MVLKRFRGQTGGFFGVRKPGGFRTPYPEIVLLVPPAPAETVALETCRDDEVKRSNNGDLAGMQSAVRVNSSLLTRRSIRPRAAAASAAPGLSPLIRGLYANRGIIIAELPSVRV